MATDVSTQVKALSPEAQAQISRAGAKLHQATQHAPSAPTLVVNNSDSNYAQRQMAQNQDKAQAALSPTDRFAGKTAVQGQQPAQAVDVKVLKSRYKLPP